MTHRNHLFTTCRDDHAATPAECRRDMAGLLARTAERGRTGERERERDDVPPHGIPRPLLPGSIEAGIR